MKSTAIDEIIAYMESLPYARKIASGEEITMRCPFCGDSDKSASSTNFYINIDPSSDNFLQYKCFRASCGVQGIADQYFLEMIGYSGYEQTMEFNNYMSAHKRKMKVSNSTKGYKSKNRKALSNYINTKNPVSDKKLEYINNRLGLDLGYEDLMKFKISLNLNSLLSMNGISVPYNKTYYYTALSNYGISFISLYNDYVIIRDISKDGRLHKRYTNINIFNSKDAVTKMYCIPTKLNMLSTQPTVMNIAEGAFDILGVYHHLNIDREFENQLFIAASGAGIRKAIIHFMVEYGLIDVRINIFSDADVDRAKYNNIKRLGRYMRNFDVRIFYNTKSKDFGVRKEDINIISSRL